ncbi:TRAP transporter small permease [Paracoccus methylarcula]|uniref:TRAP transporter small permease protein n=1 Tax=Paracoccus methylarcula TaxID=72022 RepID=A0A3R7LPJ5_9RHOB|nr:TRAP transporter small permease [Paracoccus methylarcula]RNF34346.1 TRAP transporter small permease [Paracoccus methylarcula]
MERVFTLVLSRVDAVARVVLLGCMTVMIVVVATQVLMRYAFNASIDWADEVSRLAFVWSIFIAIPLGIREGAHVGIELLINKLPRKLARQVTRTMLALAFLLMCVVTYEAVVVAYETWSERLGAINISSSYFFVAVIVGSAHAALHLLHLVLHPLDEHGPEYPID